MTWQPTPTLLPGKPHGQRSLGGYSLWGHGDSIERARTHNGHISFLAPCPYHMYHLQLFVPILCLFTFLVLPFEILKFCVFIF